MEQRAGLHQGPDRLDPGALKIAYAVGQLVNGQLAERILAAPAAGHRHARLGRAERACSASAQGLYFLLFVWACNGYCQALGWTPCMRVAANWIPVARRGRAIGIIGTSYQFMAALTFMVAGWPASMARLARRLLRAGRAAGRRRRPHAGVPARVARRRRRQRRPRHARVADVCRHLAREHPRHADQPGAVVAGRRAVPPGRLPLRLPGLGPDAPEGGARRAASASTALKYAVLAAGGIAGALFAGWATDRFFQGRRAPVICRPAGAAGRADAGLRFGWPAPACVGHGRCCCC